jgi:probable phosphoglycerate mutase
MDIWLVRHGATQWSRSGRHTSHTDLPLLPDGEEEARRLGKRLDGHEFGRVLCSPLARARETAKLAGFGDRAEVTDLLREVDYGEYEGLTTAEIHEARPGWELLVDGSPGGESPEQVSARADRFLALLGDRRLDVLCFAHGHILRAVAARYLGLDVAVGDLLKLDSGTLSVLGHEHDHHALTLWNEQP